MYEKMNCMTMITTIKTNLYQPRMRLSNQDAVHTSDYEDVSDDDDIYDVSEQDVLDMIRHQKNELTNLKSVFHPTNRNEVQTFQTNMNLIHCQLIQWIQST